MKWLGISLPLRDIHADPAHQAALVQGGGMDQVPCLRIDGPDGKTRWLYESDDILAHLKARLAERPPSP